MAWVLTRGLTTVRNEFNKVFPSRDKASDGTLGNRPHAESISGHNPDRTGRAEYKDADAKDEVRALDVDKDLRSNVSMEYVVQYLVKRARAGFYVPFEYVIFNKRIWCEDDGWKTHEYNGANDHTGHVHFSGRYSQTGDEWSGSLGLASLIRKEDEMELSDKIRLVTGGEVKYSSTTTTVAGVLASTNYYVLTLRKMTSTLQAEVAVLRGIVQDVAVMVKAGGGNIDTAAILAGMDERLAKLPQVTADAVIGEIAS